MADDQSKTTEEGTKEPDRVDHYAMYLAQENARLRGAIGEVIAATQAYMPPDGIPARDCISLILRATDNPEINAILARGRTS